MSRRTESSAIIDGLLKVILTGGVTTLALMAPNSIQLFDKPLRKYFSAMDERSRQRELNRLVAYAKRKNLIADDYEHGFTLTDKARKRLETAQITELTIPAMLSWDQKWRITFYDIPEKSKNERDKLTAKLRQLGCYQLQKSTWVHPFPYEDVILAIAVHSAIEKYITYIETTYISNETVLRSKFPTIFIT